MTSRPYNKRQPLQHWLPDKVDTGDFPEVKWIDKRQRILQIPWTNQKTKDWSKDKSLLFIEYAKHTNKFTTGDRKNIPGYKQNFKSAVGKNKFIKRLDGPKQFRIYKIISDPQSKGKRRKMVADLDEVRSQLLQTTLSDPREITSDLGQKGEATVGLFPLVQSQIFADDYSQLPVGIDVNPGLDLLSEDTSDLSSLIPDLSMLGGVQEVLFDKKAVGDNLAEEQVNQITGQVWDQCVPAGDSRGQTCIQNTTVDSTTVESVDRTTETETGYFSDLIYGWTDLNDTSLSQNLGRVEESMSLSDRSTDTSLDLAKSGSSTESAQHFVGHNFDSELAKPNSVNSTRNQINQNVLYALPKSESSDTNPSMETQELSANLNLTQMTQQVCVTTITTAAAMPKSHPITLATTMPENLPNTVKAMLPTYRPTTMSAVEAATPTNQLVANKPSRNSPTSHTSMPTNQGSNSPGTSNLQNSSSGSPTQGSCPVSNNSIRSPTSSGSTNNKFHIQVIYNTGKSGGRVVLKRLISEDKCRIFFGTVDNKRMEQIIQSKDNAVQIELPSVDECGTIDEQSKKKIRDVLDNMVLGVVLTYRNDDIFVVRRCKVNVFLSDSVSKSESLPRSSIKKPDVETLAFDFNGDFMKSVEEHKQNRGFVGRDHFFLTFGYEILKNDDSPCRLLPFYIVVRHVKAAEQRPKPNVHDSEPMKSETDSFEQMIELSNHFSLLQQ